MSTSPPVSSSAFLQSIMPAPVLSRSSLTSEAVIVGVLTWSPSPGSRSSLRWRSRRPAPPRRASSWRGCAASSPARPRPWAPPPRRAPRPPRRRGRPRRRAWPRLPGRARRRGRASAAGAGGASAAGAGGASAAGAPRARRLGGGRGVRGRRLGRRDLDIARGALQLVALGLGRRLGARRLGGGGLARGLRGGRRLCCGDTLGLGLPEVLHSLGDGGLGGVARVGLGLGERGLGGSRLGLLARLLLGLLAGLLLRLAARLLGGLLTGALLLGAERAVALEDHVADCARDHVAGADAVVVAGDDVVDPVGVAVGVDEADDRDPQALRLAHRDRLGLEVDHEQGVRDALHVLHAAEVGAQLLEVGLGGHPLARRQQAELALGLVALQVVQALDPGGDRLEVRQQPAEPAMVHVRLAGRLGDLLDAVAGLLLGADEQHRAAAPRQPVGEALRRAEQRLGAQQVDDVDAAALAEDEPAHLRIPAARLVAEVHAGLQQLPDPDL